MSVAAKASTATDSHLIYPPTPRGDNRPGGGVPARASVPRIRALNIIPSELCNSLHQRRCHARTSVKVIREVTTHKRNTSSLLHNSDYAKCLRRQSAEVIPSNLPGEAAAGEGLAAVAGPSPALCQPRTWQRNRGPAPPNSSTRCRPASASASFGSPSPASASVLCEHPAALCSEAAGRPGTKGRQSRQAGQPTFGTVPPR